MITYLEMKLIENEAPLKVDLGESKMFTVPTYVGEDTTIEMSFELVDKKHDGVIGHAQPYVRNRGGMGQLSQPDQAVHPEYIKVVVEGLKENKSINKKFGRENLDEHSAVKIDGVWWAVRDLAFKEPGRIKYENGKLELFLLDDRAPNYGYPVRKKLWSSQVEDIASVNNHRLPGGHMYMWDTYALQNHAFNHYWMDPHPTFTPEDMALFGYVGKDGRNENHHRLQALIDSIVTVNTDDNGVLKDDFNETTLTWYKIQAWGRFATWNHKDEYLDVADSIINVGWQSWGDLFWAQAHYNLGYLWTNTMTCIYLDSVGPARDIAWWILQRFARFELTTGLNWTLPKHGKNHPRHGFHWYEKSSRVKPEVGSYYHPSSYKQYTGSILTAAKIYSGYKFAEDAKDAHLDALFRMGYENHNGNWGVRTLGWGMSNSCEAYKHTKDDRFKNLAIAIADNTIGIMKDPNRRNEAAFLLGKEDPWWDDVYGLPYICNQRSNPKNMMQSWEFMKVVKGFITVQLTFQGEVDYDPKIFQMMEFAYEELFYHDADVLCVRNKWSPDRILASYNNGTSNFNYPTASCSHLAWNNIPLGYMAIKTQDKKWTDLFKRNYSDTFKMLDYKPDPVSYDYWEGHAVLEQIVSGIKIPGDFAGVTDRHTITLKRGSFYGVYNIVSVSTQHVVIDVLDPDVLEDLENPNWHYHVSGPIVAAITRDDLKAVKNINRKSVSWPDLTRKISWREGLYYNTHPKVWGQCLVNYTTLGFIDKFIDGLNANSQAIPGKE